MSIQTAEKTDQEVMKRIVVELERLGVPKHVSGYIFLRQAIMLTYRDYTLLLKNVTRKLYPALAAGNETTPARVERAIRHAIESSKYLYTEGKPSNSEVIAEIADRLRMQDGII